MSENMFPNFRLTPTVLSRTAPRIIRTEVYEYLTFIWWMSRDIDDTSKFGSILWMIYIPFNALARALTNIRVSILQGDLFSDFPAVTRTAGIWPIRFVNKKILQQLHKYIMLFTFVQTYLQLKTNNGFTIKHLIINLPNTAVRRATQQIFLKLCLKFPHFNFPQGTYHNTC